jgi:cytochrome c oxidase subunit 4
MSHDPKAAAHAHPSGATYVKVGAILTLITVVEVWAYYVPVLVASPWFNPALIILSAAKFATVVLFYMHLKYDHKIFRVLFTGPLIIAMTTIVALLFLFRQLILRF